MIQSMQREAIVDTLLNTLEVERYVRAPLLLELVDELSGMSGLEPAADAARGILHDLQQGKTIERDFAARVDALRQLILELGGGPQSGERLIDPLARSLPRIAAATTASAA